MAEQGGGSEPDGPSADSRDWARLRPRLARLCGLAGVLLAALTLQLQRMDRPRPRAVSWEVEAPPATPLVKGARPAPLRVRFSDAAARLEDAGRPARRGARLSPPLRGEWSWASESELRFTPSEDWPAGQEYELRLEPGLLPPQLRLERTRASFRTAAFFAAIASCEFLVDPQDARVKRVAATLRFSHPVDSESLERRLSMTFIGPRESLLDSGRRPQRWRARYDEFFGEAYLVSEPVGIPLEPGVMAISVAPGVSPRRGGPATGGELLAQVRVPGMYDFFRIEGAEAGIVRDERQEPEQVLTIQASAGLEEKALAEAIRAWVLPSTRPAAPGRGGQPAAHWSARDVGPGALAQAAPVELTPIPGAREHASSLSFKLRAPAESDVFVRVPRGLTGYGGYRLSKDFEAVVRLPAYPRELKLLHEGALLRLSGDRKLSLYALGVGAARIELSRVRASQINHLATQSEGDFAHPAFKGWSFGPDNISERFEEVRVLEGARPDKLRYFAVDLGAHLSPAGSGSRNGLFFLRVEGWDPVRKRAIGGEDSRFVLVTDLGVLVKENADHSRDVFVQSLETGGPAAGVRIEALGANGVPVASALTGEDGRARLPDLRGFTRERRPAALIARRGEDVSFLPFDRGDRWLDHSRFDVGGVSTRGRERELSAYLFSDRGLYRPGETAHVGVLVRPHVWGPELAGLPIELAVLDPRGLEVRRSKIALSPAAFESIDVPTQENGLTGSYQVHAYIVKDGRRGALLGSTAVRVEEFLPDRLRIDARFPSAREKGWVDPKGLKALVSLRNLFGAPAEARKVTAALRLSPAAPWFEEWAEYSFFDPAAARKSFTERLGDAATGADGEASIEVPLERFAAGTYRVELEVEGFEAEGGRGVAAHAAVLVSPRASLLGLKPDGELRYVSRGSSRTARAVNVGPDGSALALSSMTLRLIEERWVSSLVKGPDGLYRYQSVRRELAVSTAAAALGAGPGAFRLDTSQPGDYALLFLDPEGAELNRLRYTVAGHGNLARSLEKNAELQLRLKKGDYAPGETVELQVKAPYAGAGLITIERDRVHAHKWFRAEVSASTHGIRVPEGVEGNAYVSVAFVRAADSREIFMSPLSHGVAPFTVSRARRELPVILEVPEAVRPGRTVPVRVKTPRRARVAVFAADEGILQAAGWRTPDPLGHFLAKRALEVRSFQLLDLLLPEHRVAQSVMAPGGDQGWDAAGKNLNPFKRRRDKPAVAWSGVVDAGPEGRTIAVEVPDSFNGTLRVTAVAAEPDAVGVASRKMLVRQPIVLSPNAPLFVAPGDEFEASVAVANGVPGSGPRAKARVTLEPSGHLQTLGEPTRELEVGEQREGSAVFRLRAKESLGAATLAYRVSIGSESARREHSLSVRPPAPYQVAVESGHLRAGKAAIPAGRSLYPAYRTLEAAVSPLPLALAPGLLQYLEAYPYGCTEQVLSQAFPALALRKRPELGWEPRKVESNLARAFEILRSRQNEDGAFGFWAANSFVSDFHAVYAAHFMTEAKEAGYPVPHELLERALGYVHKVAAGAPGTSAPPRVRAYAIYMLTRNGRITTPLIDALRRKLELERDEGWRKDLTAAYLGASCALLRLDGPAETLMNGVSSGEGRAPDYEWFYDELAHESQRLYLLARHFPSRLGGLDGDAVLRVSEPLSRGRYNSLSSAYAILALDAYAAAAGPLAPDEARLAERRDDGSLVPLPLPPGLFAKASFSPAARSLELENRSGRRVFYQAVQSGYERELPREPVRRGLEIRRELLDETGAPATVLELGREYLVRLRVRALERGRVPHVAVVDLLPGGLEPSWRERDEGRSEREQYRDLREDRALFFGSADSGIWELSYRARASSRGRFVLPPPYAESMYERGVRAWGEAGTVEVR